MRLKFLVVLNQAIQAVLDRTVSCFPCIYLKSNWQHWKWHTQKELCFQESAKCSFLQSLKVLQREKEVLFESHADATKHYPGVARDWYRMGMFSLIYRIKQTQNEDMALLLIPSSLLAMKRKKK